MTYCLNLYLSMAKGGLVSGDIIITSGIFIDITIPLDCAQTFLERIEADPVCQLDRNNCYISGDQYYLRLTARTFGQSASLKFIRYLSKEFGLNDAEEKDQ